MDHIQDVYKKKSEMIEKIWDHLTKVNLKVDGKPFQVVYNEEEDELEYHGRSGNETKVGPLIDDMSRLFSKPINDAIRHIENRVEIFKRYKFLTFEVINEILLLTAIITKDGEFINDPDKIDSIAKELDTDVMPCLWKGKISEEQKEVLMQVISTDIVPTKDEFIKWVKELFGTYDKFPKSLISRSEEFIEGLVFFYDVNGKVVEYKLVDPAYRNLVKDNQNKNKDEEITKKFEGIYNIFVDWSEDNAKALDKNRIRSIEFNFIEMMKNTKIYNKLMNLGSGLTLSQSDSYFLQLDRISDELRKEIKKHGSVYQLLFEKFVKLFYKAKKRGFVISKEFQGRVNKLIDIFADYSLNENLIEINGNLYFNENLLQIIIPKTADEFRKYLEDYNLDISKTKLTNNIIDLIYEKSKEIKSTINQKLPFVCNYKGIPGFVTRRWVYRKINDKIEPFNVFETVRGIYKGLHNSSYDDQLNIISRSQQGLSQEQEDLEDIIKFCYHIYSSTPDRNTKLTETQLNNIFDNKIGDFKRLYGIYQNGSLDWLISQSTIVEQRIKTDDICDPKHWEKYITNTGKESNKRNSNNQLFSPDFIFSDNNEEEVLNESGKIISDITINDPNGAVYISCKMKESQLSGISVRKVMQTNNNFQDAIKNNKQYLDVKENLHIFNNFWYNFGIDPEEIYNIYLNREIKEHKTTYTIKSKNYDKKKIGSFIRKLVGGNYWYLKPNTLSRFVYPNKHKLEFEIQTINISESKETITIIGKLINERKENIDCKIIMRTDGNGTFPYRLFPSVNVFDLLDLISDKVKIK